MAATVRVNEFNGAGATETLGVTSLNFGAADVPNLTPASYSIQRGTCSFDKYWKVHFYGGTFNKVSVFKFWRCSSEGGEGAGLPTGVSIGAEVGTSGGGDLVYAQPSASDKSLSACPSTVGTALAPGPSELTAFGKTYYIHCQMVTTEDAATGDVPTMYFALQWQEE
jgi:hypothetical protein